MSKPSELLDEHDIGLMFKLRYEECMRIFQIAHKFDLSVSFCSRILKGDRLRKWSKPLFKAIKEKQGDIRRRF